MTPYLAQIMTCSFDFAPKGWAFCAAQLLAINQNQALFSILGTTYGGNGMQTFALPDLRGRVPINWGQGPGQPDYTLGEIAGLQTVTLLAGNLPAHSHLMSVSNAAGNSQTPASCVVAKGAMAGQVQTTPYATTAGSTMSPLALTNAGSNLPFSILQPYLTLNYVIATTGIFPSRN
jgi:microcystin-dependent protein